MSNLFTQRLARAEDLDRIVEIERDTDRGPGLLPWSREHFETEMAKPFARVRVAESSSGEVAGYIVYWVQEGNISILNVAVAPAFRRQGVGHLLVQRLIEELNSNASNHDAAWIQLEVRENNAPAYRLYERLGFKKIALRPRFYSDGAAAFILEYRLSQS